MNSFTQKEVAPFIGQRVRLCFSIGGSVPHWSGPYWIVMAGVHSFGYKASPIRGEEAEVKNMLYGTLKGIEEMPK